MSVDILQLPKDEKALCRVIDKHAEREEARLRYRVITWKLLWYYLNGARRFDVFDPRTGALQPHFVDEQGNMEFQAQDLLFQINRVSARIASMDLRPRIMASGTSLDAMRQRAVSQVAMDSVISETQLDLIKDNFAYIFTALGSCGITGYIVDHPTVGLTTDLEVIHPGELFPFPSLGHDHTKVRGIMRQRVVPFEFLKQKFGASRIEAAEDDLEFWDVMVGEPLGKNWDPINNGSYLYTSQPIGSATTWATGAEDSMKEVMRVCRVRELWLDGPRGTCQRYVVTCGEKKLDDMDFEGQEVYCPIGFARFMQSGTFHGLGLFDLLFPIQRQLELMLKSLFNNMRDIDRYGVVCIPTGQWNERTVLRDVGRGLRVLPWEPDPMSEGFRPFPITPFNSGDAPGKTAAFAKELMASINPLPDLAEEKGRVDSAQGLQFLDEQISQAMTSPSRGVTAAFGQAYRGVMAQTTRALLTSPRALPVGRLTLDLAGAVIDPVKNTVSFTENPIPDIGRLVFTIKESNPRSQAARKQEAYENFDKGLNDPDSLKLLALDEGLDLAIWMKEDQAPYEVIVRDILTMYGDGVTPGQVIFAPHISKPQLQLRVLGMFMSSLAMRNASARVIDAFKAYRETLISWMGMTLPNAVPNPDDAAMLTPPGIQQMQQNANQNAVLQMASQRGQTPQLQGHP